MSANRKLPAGRASPGTRQKSGEFELIAKYFAPLAADEPGAFGLRDDVAFLETPVGQDLVVKTDGAIEGVHFFADDPPHLIARKTLRRNLSDLAAKGAVPRWYLLNAAFSKKVGDAWIRAFAKGLARDQAEFDVRLVGGDTTVTPGPATFAITALGFVRSSWGLRRAGARAGDNVYVTGTIGDGALGLLARQGKLNGLKAKPRDFLIDRYHLPRPRLSVGHHLLGVATASIDISDGLLADLGHLCATSKVAAVIEEALVPLSPAVKAVLARQPKLIESVLGGGDDYEILFTAPTSAEKVLEHLAAECKVPITRIGRVVAGKGATVIDASGKRRPLAHTGWTHS